MERANQSFLERLIFSKAAIYIGILLETDVLIKLVYHSGKISFKALLVILSFYTAFVCMAVWRHKRVAGTSCALLSQALFLSAVMVSGLDPKWYSNITFSLILAYSIVQIHPLLTLLFGFSISWLYIVHSPGDTHVIGSIVVALIFPVLLNLAKRIYQDREKYRNASMKDNLTNAYNSAYSIRTGQTMFESGKPLRVLLIDIDNFKQINDTYGHLAGNKILTFVADKLGMVTSDIRGFMGRIGGDEFVIVVEESPNAAEIKNMAQLMLRDHPFKLDEEIDLPIQLSIGEVLSWSRDFKNFEQLLHEADRNMYFAKQDGSILSEKTSMIAMLQQDAQRLLDILREKDLYTYTHSLFVAQYAGDFAVQLGMEAESVRDLQIAGLLHDVGKIMTPFQILRKEEKLSNEEYEVVKQHVKEGILILQSLELSEATCNAIKFHHERWDGRGYPYGLEGIKQPLEARILQIADALSAMTIKRIYRQRISLLEAAEVIEKEAGKQFDPQLAAAFSKSIKNHLSFK